jgi:hypothetical protein
MNRRFQMCTNAQGELATILTLANWGTGLILIGRDGRSESTVNRISRFVFALPTRERLEAKSSPQMAPTFSEQNGPAFR